MDMDQAAFDEAFEELVREDALDEVIRNLAAVGVIVQPWQRPILDHWLWKDEHLPMPVRVLRLQRCLTRANIGGCNLGATPTFEQRDGHDQS